MSDSMLIGLKHTHTLFVFLFVLHYLVKSFMYLRGNTEGLQKYQSKTRVLLDMVAPTLFILTGVAMLVHIGMGNIGGWFHLKLTLVIILLPVSIIAFRKQSKPLIIASGILFVYLILLAYLKTPLLFF